MGEQCSNNDGVALNNDNNHMFDDDYADSAFALSHNAYPVAAQMVKSGPNRKNNIMMASLPPPLPAPVPLPAFVPAPITMMHPTSSPIAIISVPPTETENFTSFIIDDTTIDSNNDTTTRFLSMYMKNNDEKEDKQIKQNLLEVNDH